MAQVQFWLHVNSDRKISHSTKVTRSLMATMQHPSSSKHRKKNWKEKVEALCLTLPASKDRDFDRVLEYFHNLSWSTYSWSFKTQLSLWINTCLVICFQTISIYRTVFHAYPVNLVLSAMLLLSAPVMLDYAAHVHSKPNQSIRLVFIRIFSVVYALVYGYVLRQGTCMFKFNLSVVLVSLVHYTLYKKNTIIKADSDLNYAFWQSFFWAIDVVVLVGLLPLGFKVNPILILDHAALSTTLYTTSLNSFWIAFSIATTKMHIARQNKSPSESEQLDQLKAKNDLWIWSYCPRGYRLQVIILGMQQMHVICLTIMMAKSSANSIHYCVLLASAIHIWSRLHNILNIYRQSEEPPLIKFEQQKG